MPWRAGHREAWFQFWGENQASRVLRRMDSPPEDGLSQMHSRVALWEKRRQGEVLTGHDSFLDRRISSDPAHSPSVKCRSDEEVFGGTEMLGNSGPVSRNTGGLGHGAACHQDPSTTPQLPPVRPVTGRGGELL